MDIQGAQEIVKKLDPLHDIPPFLHERIAEALVEAFDDGMQKSAHELSAMRKKLDLDGPELLAELLWHYGIGIATLEETEARTRAIARGEIKCAPDEPKLWFSSIEVLIGWVKNKANPFPEKDCD